MAYLKIISADEVAALLPMDECIDVMQAAMQAASSGEIHVPLRIFMPLIDESAFFALMPGSAKDPSVYGAKIISLHEDNAARDLPTIQGFVTLFDHVTGSPLSIIEGGSITAIRTAAASGLATRILAPDDACSHGILGTGVQAVTHIDAIASVRQTKSVVIWGRNYEKAGRLAAAQAARTGLDVRATRDPAEAAACDIVSTVTASVDPILRGEWVRRGAHVNLVGAHSATTREADTALITKASIFTDLLESLLHEGGDVVIPIDEGAIDAGFVKGEIGKVISGEIPGRKSDREITVYKSLGITAQDLFAAHRVYTKALSTGAGSDVEFQ